MFNQFLQYCSNSSDEPGGQLPGEFTPPFFEDGLPLALHKVLDYHLFVLTVVQEALVEVVEDSLTLPIMLS